MPTNAFIEKDRTQFMQTIFDAVKKPVIEQNGHSGWNLETREDIILHLREEIKEYFATFHRLRSQNSAETDYVQEGQTALDERIFSLASEIGDVWYLLTRLSACVGSIPDEFLRVMQHTIYVAETFGFDVRVCVLEKVLRNIKKYAPDLESTLEGHAEFRQRKKEEWEQRGGDVRYEIEQQSVRAYGFGDPVAIALLASYQAVLHRARLYQKNGIDDGRDDVDTDGGEAFSLQAMLAAGCIGGIRSFA